MDLYYKKIIFLVLSLTLEVKQIVQAINKAKSLRNVDETLIIQSDKGIQYTCKDYRKVTKNVVASYLKSGCATPHFVNNTLAFSCLLIHWYN